MKVALVSSFALALVGSVAGQQTDHYCGYGGTCPWDSYCAPVNDDCKDLKHCPGRCWYKNEYISCGGYSRDPKKCPKGCECVSDPRRPYIPDLPGICITKGWIFPKCRGYAGLHCPEGTYCYDDPWGGCDPKHPDCQGICV